MRRVHGKKEEPGTEKDRADQSEARKPEDNLLQPGDSNTNLLQKVSLKKILFVSGLCFVKIMKERIFKNTVLSFVL